MEYLKITEDNVVSAVQTSGDGEKVVKRVPLGDLLENISAIKLSEQSLTPILPPNTRLFVKKKDYSIVVVEQLPAIRTVNWNRRLRHLAFPYIVYFFYCRGNLPMSYKSRLYYRNQPIDSFEDKLYMCNLSHVADGSRGYALGEMCIVGAGMQSELSLGKNIEIAIRHFWQSRFQLADWSHPFVDSYKKMGEKDSRLSSLVKWEEESQKDPLFPLSVEWIDSNLTVKELIDNLLEGITVNKVETMSDILDQMMKS